MREYVSGTIAPHLIGTLGPIYPEEYESLKDKGYQLNDILGKSGIEQAMESSLRGTTGTRVLVRDASGAIVDEYESAAAVAGNSVVLTLDKNLQKTTEDLIMAKMAEMRLMQPTATKKWRGQDIRSGSVVLLDVKNRPACWSAPVSPDTDLSTYSSEYANLLNDPEKPLFNGHCTALLLAAPPSSRPSRSQVCQRGSSPPTRRGLPATAFTTTTKTSGSRRDAPATTEASTSWAPCRNPATFSFLIWDAG